MIAIGPFLFNTIVGGLIALPASLPVFEYHNANPFDYLLIYLGVSIAMHAFPSTGDANVIMANIKEDGTPFLAKIIGYPLIGLIYVGSFGSMLWLDVLYGVGVAVGLPKLIIWILA